MNPVIFFIMNILYRPTNSREIATSTSEALFLKQFLEYCGILKNHPISIWEDHFVRKKLGQTAVMHKLSKHILTKFRFIQEKTNDGTIAILYIPTEKLAAHILEKTLTPIEAGNSQKCYKGLRYIQLASIFVGVMQIELHLTELISSNLERLVIFLPVQLI